MKGQAALEFLTTYGWAILTVLIAIGALSSLIVFKFGILYPDSCFTEPGMVCQEYGGSYTNNEIYFEIINTLGKDIITNITITTSACNNSPITKEYSLIKTNQAITNNTETEITIIPCDFQNNRVSGDIEIEYMAVGEDLTHKLEGDFNFFVK